MSGDIFGDIATDVERVPCIRVGARHVHTLDGLAYSNLGLGIKCVVDAWAKAHGECISTGVPVKCTKAWLLMQKAMRVIDTLVQTDDVDIDTPCYTDADGSNPYYTPLQYLCVLNKVILPGSWTSNLAMQLLSRGASLEHSNIWTTEMKSHATRLLCLPVANQQDNDLESTKIF